MANHWIPISVSDYTAEELNKTLHSCYTIYLWTYAKLKQGYLEKLSVASNLELTKDLTENIRESVLPRVQRYTINRAMEKAATEFRQRIRMVGEKEIEFPLPMAEKDYLEFQIEARQIWRKYLEDYGGISTTYGMLMLEGDWDKTLEAQAAEMHEPMRMLPLLWYSITIRKVSDSFCLQFNLHQRSWLRTRKKERSGKTLDR